MKGRYRNIAIIVGIILAFLATASILICNLDKEVTDPSYPTIENAASVYEQAIDTLNHTEDFSIQITYKKETLIGSEYITEQSMQAISYKSYHTDAMQAELSETLSVGTHTVDISEVFRENAVYVKINDCTFRGSLDASTYRSRYIPAQTINDSLYNTISGEDTGSGYTIYFSDPTAIESWLLADNMSLRQASGTAYINTAGQLTKSIYSASYTVDDYHFRLTSTVEINYDPVDPIKLPKDTETYITLESPEAPRLLEIACGYLLDADSLQATCKDEIVCEAFGDKRTQTVTLNTDLGNTWTAQIDTSVEVFNSSKAGATTTFSQTETFKDNVYSVSVDNAPATNHNDIDITTMRNYCRDLLVGTIILPQYITSAVITESSDTYTIHFTGNDAFAQLIDSEACTALYQDTGVLSGTAQSYQLDTMNCSLEIDKNTGLPVRSSLDYQGTYTIDDLPYKLQFLTEHQYVLQNKEAGA